MRVLSWALEGAGSAETLPEENFVVAKKRHRIKILKKNETISIFQNPQVCRISKPLVNVCGSHFSYQCDLPLCSKLKSGAKEGGYSVLIP